MSCSNLVALDLDDEEEDDIDVSGEYDESSMGDLEFSSEEMSKLLQLDGPPMQSPRSMESYSVRAMFPSWVLEDPDWKSTAASNRDQISEIANVPYHQRSQEQTATLVHWLMSIWGTAHQLGFKKCVSMSKAFNFLVYEPGQDIITEGEHGQTFFIIISGSCQIHKDGIGVVAKIGKGKSFGEIALTEGNSLRTATVRAETSVEALRLHKGDYDYFVKNIQLGERRENRLVLRNSKLLASFSRAVLQKMSTTCTRHIVQAGEFIFRQGDSPDAVYFIIEGNVKIIKEVSIAVRNRWPKSINEWDVMTRKRMNHHVVSELGKGDHFGEYSILLNRNRTATAQAKTKCVLLCVDKLEFIHYAQSAMALDMLQDRLECYDKDEDILSKFSSLKGGPSTTAQLNECVIVADSCPGVGMSVPVTRMKKTRIFKVDVPREEGGDGKIPLFHPEIITSKPPSPTDKCKGTQSQGAGLTVAVAKKRMRGSPLTRAAVTMDLSRKKKSPGDGLSMKNFRRQVVQALDAAYAVNALEPILVPKTTKRYEAPLAVREPGGASAKGSPDKDNSDDSSKCSSTVSMSSLGSINSGSLRHAARISSTHKSLKFDLSSPLKTPVTPTRNLKNSARVTFEQSPKELAALKAQSTAVNRSLAKHPVIKFSEDVEDHPVLMMLTKNTSRALRSKDGVLSS